MDAKDHPVISVLGDQRRFMVPIYQRHYSWGQARLAPFWDDVVAKAEQALEGKPRFSHYMGALILAPGGDGFTIGATPQVQVVDGQQRLTTFQLFLAALREVGDELSVPGLGAVIGNYLHVSPMHGDTDADACFRLVPTPEDRPVFHLIVKAGLKGVRARHPDWFFQNGNPKGPSPHAIRALTYFVDRIGTYARHGLLDEEDTPEPRGNKPLPTADEPADMPRRRLQALLEALLNHLKLVVITLSETDDAQVIFESLNSQSEPLLAMDLVRNNIFHRASAQGEAVEALFEAKWRPFDKDRAFWKADSPALIVYAPIHRTLEVGGSDTALACLGAKLNLWAVSTVYPLVFRIAVSSADAAEKAELYALIYSYLVRRALCGLTPKALNKTFARLTGAMIRDGVSIDTLAATFASQRGDTMRFPADAELRAAIRSKPVYDLIRRKERIADVL